jgi:hypothetical protein
MSPPDDQEPTEEERRRSNLILLIVAVVVVMLGVYLVNWVVEQRKLQECLESGRRNCAPIETPARLSFATGAVPVAAPSPLAREGFSEIIN